MMTKLWMKLFVLALLVCSLAEAQLSTCAQGLDSSKGQALFFANVDLGLNNVTVYVSEAYKQAGGLALERNDLQEAINRWSADCSAATDLPKIKIRWHEDAPSGEEIESWGSSTDPAVIAR
ncbi:MAG: hypothetical protein AAF762_11770 [Pseudomonadota bacterium]